MNRHWQSLINKVEIPIEQLLEFSNMLLHADLHWTPYKDIFPSIDKSDSDLGDNMFEYHGDVNNFFSLSERSQLYNRILESEHKSNSIPSAFLFSTRPWTALELSMLLPLWCTSQNEYSDFTEYLKLFRVSFPEESIRIDSSENGLITVSLDSDNPELDKIFAVTSFQTEIKSWRAHVKDEDHEPDESRYSRLFELINQILKCKKRIDYIVFPELSLPRGVITYLSMKLKTKRISLIAGVEYQNKRSPEAYPSMIKGIVSNQLVYILTVSNSIHRDQICIVQEKIIPALEEARELYEEAGKIMEATNKYKYLIGHGGFYTSGLICNDLLDINYRQNLRGKIDAMIVVEWNKDVDTYDALVAATANDLHCFVIQVNNREYGDTRIRAPYKESYQRDRVRVRGGELDYFVIASLEVKKLRAFQNHHVSPGAYFKPVPTGYRLSSARKPE